MSRYKAHDCQQIAAVLQPGNGASISKDKQPVPQPLGCAKENADLPLKTKIDSMVLRLSIIDTRSSIKEKLGKTSLL